MTDPTKGDAPILDPGPIVEIDGTTYPLRRLGVRDTLTLAKVIAIGARGAAAYPVEFGTRHVRARRFAKRAIDQARRA